MARCCTDGSRGMVALLVAAVLLVVGCATLAQPTATDTAWAAAQWPGTTAAELARGRSLYVKRCAGCHALKHPERFPPSTWQAQLDKMAERAELADEERDLVLHFLVTMSRTAIAPPPAQQPGPSG